MALKGLTPQTLSEMISRKLKDEADAEYRKRLDEAAARHMDRGKGEAEAQRLALSDVRKPLQAETVSYKTIYRIEKSQPVGRRKLLLVANALGVQLPAEEADPAGNVAIWHGKYARDAVESNEGAYLAYRRAFSNPQEFTVSYIEIVWSTERTCLVFHETIRWGAPTSKDTYTHRGEIYIPVGSPMIYLLVKHEGAVRLTALSHFGVARRDLRGTILTLDADKHSYRPAASPVVLLKQAQPLADAEIRDAVGQIGVHATDRLGQVPALMAENERDFSVFANLPVLPDLTAVIPSAGANVESLDGTG